MKIREAELRAKQLFGPRAYAQYIDSCGPCMFKNPCRIGKYVDAQINQPLGHGQSWEDALAMAKANAGRKRK